MDILEISNEIEQGIIYFLQFDEGMTLLEIQEFLILNNHNIDLRTLREILYRLEDNNLIKERHFNQERDGRVDYSLEQKGEDLIQVLKLKNSIHKIWKLPRQEYQTNNL